MLVFWKENLVLLAVPKTGTTAIERALAPHASMAILDPPSLKHVPLYRYDRFLRPFYQQAGGKELETAAVIRNPLDWLASWYRYRARPEIVGKPNSTANISFDTFVLEAIKGDSAPYANIGSQLTFVSNREGDVKVNHLFRYENMSRYLAFLESRLDRKIDLPRINVSPIRETNLSPEVEDKLRRKWVEEFALWECIE